LIEIRNAAFLIIGILSLAGFLFAHNYTAKALKRRLMDIDKF